LLGDKSEIDDGSITMLMNTFHHLSSSSKDMYHAFYHMYFSKLSDIKALQLS
jgi:hypothetical protein